MERVSLVPGEVALTAGRFRDFVVLGWEWDVLGWLALGGEVALTGSGR